MMVRLTDPSGIETTRIQNALNSENEVSLGPGVWNSGPLFLNDDQVFEIEFGAELLGNVSEWPTGGAFDKYIPFILVRVKSDVRVTGAGSITVPEDSSYTSGTDYQWRACIALRASSNCTVDGGLTLSSRGGDGISIGPARYNLPISNDPCTNVVVDEIAADGCYRNGISIVHVDGLAVSNSTFKNSEGIAAEGGIAIEPDQSWEYVKNMTMDNCELKDNTGWGFEVQMYKLPLAVEVAIADCVIEGGSEPAASIFYRPSADEGCVISIEDTVLKSNLDSAFHVAYFHRYGSISLTNVTFERLAGHVGSLGDVRFYWDDRSHLGPFDPADYGNVNFENCGSPYKNFNVSMSDKTSSVPSIDGHVFVDKLSGAASKLYGTELWFLRTGRDGVPGRIETPSSSVGTTITKL